MSILIEGANAAPSIEETAKRSSNWDVGAIVGEGLDLGLDILGSVVEGSGDIFGAILDGIV